jgi:hypothetical protein
VPGSVVRLPPSVQEPFQVFVNGVPQEPGRDYEMRDGALHFGRSLAHEGKLGFWRWFLGAWGIGTYRAHDSVDVRYELDGRPAVAEGLAPEPPHDAEPAGG